MTATFSQQDKLAHIAQELYKRRLESLGLSSEDAKRLGLSLLTHTEMAAELGWGKGIGAIKIAYPNAKTIRYRFLGEFEGFKYYQPKGTKVQVYDSPLRDQAKPLIITEGEFKAIKGCLMGYNVVALGGVYSFYAEHGGNKQLLEPLNSLEPGTLVYIAFDYDGSGTGEPNDQVALAEQRLAAQLTLRGCEVRLVRLGVKGLGSKVGLDDYLNDGGNLDTKLLEAKLFNPSKRDGLVYLLSKYAIMDGDIVNPLTAAVYPLNKFTIEEANCINPKVESDDEEKKPPTQQFISSLDRCSIEAITFAPQYKSIITPDFKLNTWRGFKTEPVAGDVSLWHEFTDLLFSAEPEIKVAFEETIACMFQRPEVQQKRLLILQSSMEGIGKSFYFETIAAIINGAPYGRPNGKFDHALVASSEDLAADFNSHLNYKKFVVFNEIGERGDRHTNFIKNLVTAPTLTINEKFVKKQHISNFILFAITTNETYTHLVNTKSRRELIYSVNGTSMLAYKLKAFFEGPTPLKAWINTPEARSAILHYYLNIDLGDYDGTQPAPMSVGKQLMAQASEQDIDIYIREELAGVKFIVPRLEVIKFRDMFPRSNAKLAYIRARLHDAGYIKNRFDRTNSQIDLTTFDGHSELQRPIVWVTEEGFVEMDKEVIYKALNNRYFVLEKKL